MHPSTRQTADNIHPNTSATIQPCTQDSNNNNDNDGEIYDCLDQSADSLDSENDSINSAQTDPFVQSSRCLATDQPHYVSARHTQAEKGVPCKAQLERERDPKGRSLHPHPRANISIDTSPSGLQKGKSSTRTSDPRPTLARTWAPSATYSRPWRTAGESQLSFGLNKQKEMQGTVDLSNSARITTSSTASSSLLSNMLSTSSPESRPSSTSIPKMTSLSWTLPPLPNSRSAIVRTHDSLAKGSFTSATHTSLDPTSESSREDVHTPNIPMHRPYRSKSFSSMSSQGTFASSYATGQEKAMSPVRVTSSSYTSLPYSPAVAFLSNFVDVTAPRVAPDEEGARVGKYIMGKVIGHGGFSVVREAIPIEIDGTDSAEHVAVKVVKTQTGASDNDRVQRMLNKEIAIWSQISHPNVIPLIAVEKLPTDTFIFCELCEGGHLLSFLTERRETSSSLTSLHSAQPLWEDQCRTIFNQVAEAIRYLHEDMRIVHRDIKLENILRHKSGVWKICDFGLAEYQDEDAAAFFGGTLSTLSEPSSPRDMSMLISGSNELSEQVQTIGGHTVIKAEEEETAGGSLAYSSPEQLRSHKPLRCPSTDVWSLGVVLYALLTGRLPFQDEYEPRLQYQILNGQYEDPIGCSPEARDLLKNMFRSRPEERWRITQVMDSAWCKGFTSGEDEHGDCESKASSILSSFRSAPYA